MIQLTKITWDLSQIVWLAQFPTDRNVNTPEDAALVFSGPRFFIALIAGVLLAFAFQIVLTNLSVAAGISYLGRSSDDDHDDRHEHHDSSGAGGTIRKIGFAVGIWTLITVTIALFVASLLAVKLSLITSAGLGAIVGVVIWAAYFTLLVWVSSSTVGSLIGSVVNTATSGFQSLVGTATAALGARAVNQQVVSTAEAAASAVRRELGVGMDASSIRDSLEDYFERVRPAQLDMRKIRRELENLVNDPELQNIVGADSPADAIERLRSVDRSTFVNLLRDRTDLSKQEANRLVDQLEAVWNETLGKYQQRKDPTQDLVDYLKTVQSGQVNVNELNRKLDQLTEEVRRQGQTLQTTQRDQATSMRDQLANVRDQVTSMASLGGSSSQGKEDQPSLVDRAAQFGFSTLMGTVLGRTDLSDLDVEKILGQIQTARNKVTQGAQQITGQPAPAFNPIKADVENYLLHTYVWQLNRDTLEREFREVLLDPEADPGTVRRQIEQINRGDFVTLLSQRGIVTPERINEIADQLETIRLNVLNTARAAEEQEYLLDLRMRVENYLQSTPKEALLSGTADAELTSILEDSEADYELQRKRLNEFDRQLVMQYLMQRQDLTPEEADRVATQFEANRDRVLTAAQSAQERVRSEAEALRVRVESYLRNTDKSELNPEGIKRDFRLLLDDPQAGASALRGRLSQFDRDTLVQLLGQRQDMTPEEADRVISQLEDVRNNVMHAPQMVVHKAQDQVDHVTTAIEDYLRNTNLQELDPDGIKRDLNTLLQNPRLGMIRLRQRLSQIDRETLVRLLSQRQDLSEDQVNQTIDQVQQSIRSVARSPRRMASRTQQRVQTFQSALEEYLRNTDKYELNPDGIKRDLQLLLRDPRSGFGNLSNRLSHIDRETLVALLAQRKDMTEEEAHRVVDQVLSVRDQAAAQIQAIQNRVQSVIDSILDRIRNYLNSLERPELNYEGVRDDLRTLFHDPKSGFEALRDRLSHFNRDTVVALLSSREDISEADANRLIDQVENARSSVLRRAERMQNEAQRRLEEVRRQAKKQAEETRKAAASAAWWLFATAVVSAIASAIAGAIAVG